MTDGERREMLSWLSQINGNLTSIASSLASISGSIVPVIGADIEGRRFIRTGDFVADMMTRKDK